jgi:peptidyl-prolyl cis-trans isomerase C
MTFRNGLLACISAAVLAFPVASSADGHLTADTVVATVNGKEIKLGHMMVLKQRLPQQYQQLDPKVLFDGILEQLIQQTLMAEDVETLSKGAQMTLDNETRAIFAAEEIQRVVEESMSDEAIQAAYEEAYGNIEPEQEYNASHILVASEEEAKELVTSLEGGADFAELAKEKSTGPSGPRGGELGWFGKGAMVAPFEEAVLAMEVGSVSAPVETQFGWHVIKLNETRLKDAPTLDEVRGQLAEELRNKAVENHVAALTEAADITQMTTDEIDPAILDDFSLLMD